VGDSMGVEMIGERRWGQVVDLKIVEGAMSEMTTVMTWGLFTRDRCRNKALITHNHAG
jgi:hypothetical protein